METSDKDGAGCEEISKRGWSGGMSPLLKIPIAIHI